MALDDPVDGMFAAAQDNVNTAFPNPSQSSKERNPAGSVTATGFFLVTGFSSLLLIIGTAKNTNHTNVCSLMTPIK